MPRISNLLLLGTLLNWPAFAQGEEVFRDSIEVWAIDLEVVVTDSEGERVRGLGPEDFRLLLDGEQVPLDAFGEVQGGRLFKAGEAGALPSSLAEQEAGEEVATYYARLEIAGR